MVEEHIETAIVNCPKCGWAQSIKIKNGLVIGATCDNCKSIMKLQKSTATEEKPYTGVLKEADKTINGERQDSYGNPEDSFKIIAEFWSTYIKYKFGLVVKLSNLDTAHMMSLLKQARMLGQKPAHDNYVDACGYLAIAADRLLTKD